MIYHSCKTHSRYDLSFAKEHILHDIICECPIAMMTMSTQSTMVMVNLDDSNGNMHSYGWLRKSHTCHLRWHLHWQWPWQQRSSDNGNGNKDISIDNGHGKKDLAELHLLRRQPQPGQMKVKSCWCGCVAKINSNIKTFSKTVVKLP